jgi:hypothetical protein
MLPLYEYEKAKGVPRSELVSVGYQLIKRGEIGRIVFKVGQFPMVGE